MIKIHFPIVPDLLISVGLAQALRIDGLTGACYWTEGPERILYDELNLRAPELYSVADLDDADLVVYPHRASSAGPQLETVAAIARSRGIPCLFFSWGDVDEPIPVSYGTVYRHSLFADKKLPHETAMSADVADPLLELRIEISPREKKDIPSIGFCGFVSNPLMRMAYRLSGRVQKARGLAFRAKVLGAFRRASGIECTFVVRQAYWAGARGRGYKDSTREIKPRAAFWQNVLENDYTLCMRGAGNFSYRFYEVLAAGRIPVLINTKCVMPFDEMIDWREHCVWIDERDVPRAGTILRDFHSQLSPQRFRDIQIGNRKLWEKWLRPLAFYQHAIDHALSTSAKGIARAAMVDYRQFASDEAVAPNVDEVHSA